MAIRSGLPSTAHGFSNGLAVRNRRVRRECGDAPTGTGLLETIERHLGDFAPCHSHPEQNRRDEYPGW